MSSTTPRPVHRGPPGWLCICLVLAWLPTLAAESSIAVLDFELNDLTPFPGPPEEVERTASIRPLVERALAAQGGIRTVPIPTEAATRANRGFGYLYDHPEAAAELGRQAGADWILVGRLHKPSFLFAYLMGRLVDTHTGRVTANLVVEAKGQTRPVTERGAARLAEQIGQSLTGQPNTNHKSDTETPTPSRPSPIDVHRSQ
jgi:hypothetical protein